MLNNQRAEQAGDGQARSRFELIDIPDSNPYPPIKAALPDRAAMPLRSAKNMESEDQRKRPVWHWLVCLYYIGMGGLAVLSFTAIMLGPPDADPKVVAYKESLTPFRIIGTVGASVLYVPAGILLLMLRRIGLILFVTAIVLRMSDNVVMNGVDAFIPNFDALTPGRVIGRTIGHLFFWCTTIIPVFVWTRWWRSGNLK